MSRSIGEQIQDLESLMGDREASLRNKVGRGQISQMEMTSEMLRLNDLLTTFRWLKDNKQRIAAALKDIPA